MKRYDIYSILAILFIILFPFNLPASSLPLDDFVDSIQKRYEMNGNVTANFTQIAYLKQHNRKNISKGKVYLKKPRKMRWEYREPEEQLIVSDGQTLWFYTSLDEQVIRQKLHAVSPESPYNFLMGRGNLRELFDISTINPEWGNEKLIYLSLVPKKGEANIAKIIIGVNEEGLQVEETNVIDYFGNSTRIIISDIDREDDLSDGLFKFVPPEGVEIIEDDRG